ncbi:ATP-binding cassette domain-containing protein [Aquirufa nivalisilvae]|uniref:Putative ABC transporter ATP-binding protein n=1 Tax=Aquirufa nivalisilvae TaxID=2516557 RepID=A0A2S2DUD9_9BACT|nr:ATP-binding cassette domain-containing protein [Aquirufa nivalisilvae]AWL08929.1 putative ABC transporter ATP-binding protein [Aquirufa nivalisilvae]MCZ2482046.1 ATP-binding cassette domain-containing protein [Aquirufa nivalisilvae]
MVKILADIQHLSASYGSAQVLEDISFQVLEGQNWAIVGSMGSGKTTLAKALTGRLFRKGTVSFFQEGVSTSKVYWIEQQHRFKNRSNVSDFYLQQRFNSQDSADAYTILEELVDEDSDAIKTWLDVFHLTDLANKPLIQLSNGENKRLQLVKALLKHPDWLILDNPFLGLDVDGRVILSQCLAKLPKLGIHYILISSAVELPDSISHVMVLEAGKAVWQGEKMAYEQRKSLFFNEREDSWKAKLKELIDTKESFPAFQWAIQMKDVQVKYGEKVVLSGFNWEVKQGEKWLIYGPNGAGKSTMLSLISADNPQAYAQNLFLFDRKRGSGESIWDIKKRIGYVSPEMHLYFRAPGTVREVVSSGLFDIMGLGKRMSIDQSGRVEAWMDVMGLSHLSERNFQQISTGEQRLVLLTRALVKNPPLLILDEPCQGLDEDQIQHVRDLLDFMSEQDDFTLLYVSHYESDVPRCVTQRKSMK